MLSRLINDLWMASGLRSRTSCLHSTGNVRATQSNYLSRLLNENRDTDFGRAHSFSKLREVYDYQATVPARSYDELTPWIEAIVSGRMNVLTADPVQLLQPTSGTSAGRKLIPLTKSLAREFQRAVNVWTCDLMLHRPGVRSGKSYWSVSPAVTNVSNLNDAEKNQPGIVPIGYANDLAYVGFWQRHLAARLMAVPYELGRITDIDEWRFWTLLYLLRSHDLSLISVWSPTFLIELLSQLDRLAPRLLKSLASGARDPYTGRLLPRAPREASRIEEILGAHDSALNATTRLWPKLALVSSWADASSQELAQQLKQQLGTVELQPKGLMATEACITFPFAGHGNALAIESHFFEFESTDSAPSISLAHELRLGEQYEVLVTTGGGLYRYRMHDVVEVTGFINECPTLRFLGRSNQTSDMVGEKLTEPFVRACLEFAVQAMNAEGVLSILVASRSEFVAWLQKNTSADIGRCLYYLVVGGPMSEVTLEQLRLRVEQLLSENVYYRHAILHGQLQPLAMIHLPQSSTLVSVYTEYRLAKSRRIGDIKLTSLCC